MTEQDRKLASRAYLFYLFNITFLPGLGFIAQIVLWRQARSQCLAFAIEHARQSILASITAGALLTLVSGLILFIGDLASPYTWVVLILYFTLCHSSLILLGVLGFARSNGGKPFVLFQFRTWWGD
ncbi:MAG: hypothetical protein CMK89_20270 [Pseudomonadales bacterium]|nr:hypothetical protein [Pseudomonadales bacterium]